MKKRFRRCLEQHLAHSRHSGKTVGMNEDTEQIQEVIIKKSALPTEGHYKPLNSVAGKHYYQVIHLEKDALIQWSCDLQR